MSQTATIKSLPRAFRMMKAMQSDGIEWGDDYRHAGAAALKDVLEGQMANRIDRHLDEMAARAAADRRNGSYRRWLMTELGEIELRVPRTRTYGALEVVRAYARRAAHIDRMILACFVLGLSTRKVAVALAPILGRRISAGTVSQVAKTLDAAVEAFHRRPLNDIYPTLMLDGVVLSRKTGAGAIKRPVLVALGLRPDGKKEIIDYRLATAESAAQWELFLTDLWRRGLEGKALEMICVDGGAGLLAALPIVYPAIPVQRCWAHKIRNVLDKVKVADRDAVKAALHKIMNADTRPKARSAARRFADRIHFAHLRNVAKEPDGSFQEAAHLEGDTDIPAVLAALLEAAAHLPVVGDLTIMDDGDVSETGGPERMGSLRFDVGFGCQPHMPESVSALEGADVVALVDLVSAAPVLDDLQA